MNKKAQGLSINVVILLILAVLVLVLVIAGFTMGWTNMWEKVQGFFSKNNVDSIASTCNIQCATDQKYEFCSGKKTLKADTDVGANCKQNGKIFICEGSCNDFKGKIKGLDSCGIEC
jgi:hypothetical protein